MEYRNLGKSGLKISSLSFGSWVTFDNQLKDKSALSCMQMAYEHGVNFFDNAEAYANGKSEILMGKVLKKLKCSIALNIIKVDFNPNNEYIHPRRIKFL